MRYEGRGSSFKDDGGSINGGYKVDYVGLIDYIELRVLLWTRISTWAASSALG